MANRTLDYLYNHVFLPPQLPHHDDCQNGTGDRFLVEHLIEACRRFRDLNHADDYKSWSTVLRTLRIFAALHRKNNSLSKNALQSAFDDAKNGAILILHIDIQNSGLIIRKVPSGYIVESFEASPPAAEVLAAEKSLQWDFPSRAILIPSAVFEEAAFQASLAEFLEQASVEPVKQFAAVTFKARSNAFESRDTATPAVVGQLLMALLEANGQNHSIMLTRKRVNDDVCWGDGAENPWRRSPTWLVLRVGIQRSLCFLLDGPVALVQYKFFMSFTLCSISREILKGPCLLDRVAFARTKLARRVAKMQRQTDIATPLVVKTIESLFKRFGNVFTSTLQILNQQLSENWSQIRSQATKQILPLPRRADPSNTILSLSHSRDILHRILGEAFFGRPSIDIHLEERYRKSSLSSTCVTMKPHETFSTYDYLNLAETERTLRSRFTRSSAREVDLNGDLSCVDLQHWMQQYQEVASSAYKSDPEQFSLMLITLLEMWQTIDSIALKLYPLLADYEPDFPQDILYPLQVAQLSDLQRVQDIENYLQHRRTVAKPTYPSIFRDVLPTSFAVRYFDECQDMQQLAASIDAADEMAKAQKEEEWGQKSSEYEAIMKQAAETTCLFYEDPHNPLRRLHDDHRCLKHQLERRGARMRI